MRRSMSILTPSPVQTSTASISECLAITSEIVGEDIYVQGFLHSAKARNLQVQITLWTCLGEETSNRS